MNDLRVRAVVAGSNIDFFRDEAGDGDPVFISGANIGENQQASPYVDYPGNQVLTLSLVIRHAKNDTRSKVETIKNATGEITLYYGYKYHSTARSLNCIVLPESRRHYAFGEERWMATYVLNFIQSS